MTKTVIFCRGIQGSGKSTWARQWAELDSEHRIRISWDDIRNMLGKYWVLNREVLVTNASIALLKDAMANGFDIVIDNMNLSEHSTRPFIKTIEAWNDKVGNDMLVCPDVVVYPYTIEYRDFKTPLLTCIERDSKRPNPIGEQIIRNTYNKYKDFYENQPD